MASLKERMTAYKASTSRESQEIKTSSERPETVGKLKHSYVDKEAEKNPTVEVKRNFKVVKKEPVTAAEEKGKNQPGKLKRGSILKMFSPKKESSREFKTTRIDALKSKARGFAGIRLNKESAAPPPPKRISVLSGRSSMTDNNNAVNAYNLVRDKSRAGEVEELLDQMQLVGGYKIMKRISIRDNDIVQAIQKVIGNDPRQKEIKIDSDVRFAHLRSSLIQDFGDSLRQNLYLKKLTIRGVELGNTFLEALASAIRDNVTLEEIDLSRNHLTHDAMVEFCQALELNHTVKSVNLATQLSPLYEKGVDKVLDSLERNHSIKKFKIDFQGKQGYDRLKKITQRNHWNKDGYVKPNPDDLLVAHLKDEVERAEELFEQRKLEEELEEVKEGDWDYLYDLSLQFDKTKIQGDDDDSRRSSVTSYASPMHESIAKRGSAGGSFLSPGKNPLTGAQGFPSDGSFLTEEFIDEYLKEDLEKGTLIFDFCNQVRLFKQFPATSPDREMIVNCFVYEILHHPRQEEFTGINMANTGCGDDFWVKIAEEVLEDPSLLPKLSLINAETNFLKEDGIVAIAKMIQSDTCMKYLQAIKLDNQKALLSSKAERSLARALCVNISVVRFSLRVRNLLERDQINKYVLRNIDFLRQARRHHKINSGTLKQRKRNEMEQLFDKIADNDESITEVEIVSDKKYTGLSDVEKVKSASAFANNSHVKKVTMNTLGLGDDFAIALGEALATNETIESLIIEGNAISGTGFKGLFAGLGKNSSVLELRIKHQTKSMSSQDEGELPKLLETNTSITKVSLDVRNSAVSMGLDKICNRNRDNIRKNRQASLILEEEVADDAVAAVGDEAGEEEENEEAGDNEETGVTEGDNDIDIEEGDAPADADEDADEADAAVEETPPAEDEEEDGGATEEADTTEDVTLPVAEEDTAAAAEDSGAAEEDNAAVAAADDEGVDSDQAEDEDVQDDENVKSGDAAEADSEEGKPKEEEEEVGADATKDDAPAQEEED